MTPTQFECFMTTALGDLARKNNALNGLSDSTRASIDVALKTIEFENLSQRVHVTGTVAYIGTYVEHLRSWQWAWATEGLSQESREEARQLQELRRITNQEMFTREFVDDVTPSMTLRLAALAVQHFGALGSFRFGSDPQVYFAVLSIQRVLQ
jgi:hypothetical protein